MRPVEQLFNFLKHCNWSFEMFNIALSRRPGLSDVELPQKDQLSIYIGSDKKSSEIAFFCLSSTQAFCRRSFSGALLHPACRARFSHELSGGTGTRIPLRKRACPPAAALLCLCGSSCSRLHTSNPRPYRPLFGFNFLTAGVRRASGVSVTRLRRPRPSEPQVLVRALPAPGTGTHWVR